ncbi:MAG: sortase [Rhodoluna sp.]
MSISKTISVIAAIGTTLALSVAGATSATATPVLPGPIFLKPMAVIGQLYVPRFGKTYVRTIQEGTTPSVLNGAGLGHYIGTQLPGDQGNFAIAGHRAANGGPMLKIDKFRKGDLAFVKTKTDWFTYRWVSTKIVKPTDVSVVYPVPVGMPGAESGGSYLTLTSCTPIHVNTFRIAAWFELVSATLVSDGVPDGLKLVK